MKVLKIFEPALRQALQPDGLLEIIFALGWRRWYRKWTGGHWEKWSLDSPVGGETWLQVEECSLVTRKRPAGLCRGTPTCEEYREAVSVEVTNCGFRLLYTGGEPAIEIEDKKATTPPLRYCGDCNYLEVDNPGYADRCLVCGSKNLKVWFEAKCEALYPHSSIVSCQNHVPCDGNHFAIVKYRELGGRESLRVMGWKCATPEDKNVS